MLFPVVIAVIAASFHGLTAPPSAEQEKAGPFVFEGESLFYYAEDGQRELLPALPGKFVKAAWDGRELEVLSRLENGSEFKTHYILLSEFRSGIFATLKQGNRETILYSPIRARGGTLSFGSQKVGVVLSKGRDGFYVKLSLPGGKSQSLGLKLEVNPENLVHFEVRGDRITAWVKSTDGALAVNGATLAFKPSGSISATFWVK